MFGNAAAAVRRSVACRLDPAGDLATGAFRKAAALDPYVHPRLRCPATALTARVTP